MQQRWRFLIAASVSFLAAGVSYISQPVIEGYSFSIMLVAVTTAAWYGGAGAGAMAAGLSLVFRVLFDENDASMSVEAARSVAFLVSASGICLMASKLQRSLRKARRHLNEFRESEERFQNLCGVVPVKIWQTDADRSLIYLNRRWGLFSGRPIDEDLGSGWRQAMHPDDLERVEQHFATCFAQRSDYIDEFRLLRYDGIYRIMYASGIPRFNTEGEFVGYLGTCLDVTEQRSAAERLGHAQKMEAVGQLAGGVAHDFNNVLMVVQTFAQFIVNETTSDQPSYSDALEIRKACERAARLTRQLLAFERNGAPTPEPINVNDGITDLSAMLRPLLGSRIDLDVRLSPIRGYVMIERGQFEQVVVNLAVNARDAMPDGGRLTIESMAVELNPLVLEAHADRSPQGTYVMMRLSDTGQGMEGTIKSRIFEPFFTTKPAGQGTGLGLATVYAIVTKTGGIVECDSMPGNGTTFTIYWPLSQTEVPLLPADEVAFPTIGKILLVEDEPAIRIALRRLLELNGYTVVESPNGQDALEALTNGLDVDLVLTDMVMPKMGGRVLYESIHARWPLLPVVFMTGYADDLGLAPNVTVLQKPFKPERLVAVIESIRGARV